MDTQIVYVLYDYNMIRFSNSIKKIEEDIEKHKQMYPNGETKTFFQIKRKIKIKNKKEYCSHSGQFFPVYRDKDGYCYITYHNKKGWEGQVW